MSLIFLIFKIGIIIGKDQLRKFSTLRSLLNCVLILLHDDADPDRGFSVNKHQLNIHGSTASEETVEALRFVKDCLNRKGGVESIKVSKGLIKVCQKAHSLYTQEFAEKRKQEIETKEAAIRAQEREKKQDKLKEMDNDSAIIKSGIEIAENSVKDGNSDLESLLAKVTLDRDAIAKAHQNISMGAKRKSELEVSLQEAQKKRQKLI